MSSYQQPLEEYLEKLKSYDYNEEQLDAVRAFRENPEVEHVIFEQYRFMVENQLMNRTRKLKGLRNIYYFDNKLWYLCHYLKKYVYLGILHSEEFLEQRSAEKERFRKEVEANKALKKKLKAEAKKATVEEVIAVKPKRKRIGKTN